MSATLLGGWPVREKWNKADSMESYQTAMQVRCAVKERESNKDGWKYPSLLGSIRKLIRKTSGESASQS